MKTKRNSKLTSKESSAKPEISKLRIIGGKWRSRKINFISGPGLRPTPDRVRETLFNWLAPTILDAACLDLFTGSGAVSFEALSRGAASVVMIEQSADAVAMIRKNAEILKAENLEVYQGYSPEALAQLLPRQFDIVFLDPPFRHNLIAPCAAWLEAHACLAEDALIYIEAEKELKTLLLPANWQIIRDKTAGNLHYLLIKRQSSS